MGAKHGKRQAKNLLGRQVPPKAGAAVIAGLLVACTAAVWITISREVSPVRRAPPPDTSARGEGTLTPPASATGEATRPSHRLLATASWDQTHGYPDEALQTYAAVIRQHADDAGVETAIAQSIRLREARRDPEAPTWNAAGWLTSLVAKYPETQAASVAEVELHKRTFSTRGPSAKSAANLVRIINTYPETRGAGRARRLLAQLAKRCLQTGQPAIAASALESLDADTGFGREDDRQILLELRGDALFALGRYPDAIESWTAAREGARQVAQSENLTVKIGDGYLRLGRTTQAAELYQQSVSLETPFAMARFHYHMGMLCDSTGDSRQAKQHYLAAIAACPDCEPALEARRALELLRRATRPPRHAGVQQPL